MPVYSVKLSPVDSQLLEAALRGQGLTFGEWTRRQLHRPARPITPSNPSPARVAMPSPINEEIFRAGLVTGILHSFLLGWGVPIDPTELREYFLGRPRERAVAAQHFLLHELAEKFAVFMIQDLCS